MVLFRQGKLAIFDKYLAWRSVECCHQIPIMEYVDNSKRRLCLYQSTGTNKTKFSCTHR